MNSDCCFYIPDTRSDILENLSYIKPLSVELQAS